MAAGGQITDYLTKAAGVPSAYTFPGSGSTGVPSVPSGQTARYLNTTNNHEYAWDGSAWQDVTGSGGSGGGALTTATASLSADVAIGTPNTYVDGVSISLGVGTWLVMATASLSGAGIQIITAKLWDGTTVYASSSEAIAGAGYAASIAISAVIVVAATTTYKMSVANNQSTGTLTAAAPANGAGNNATRINAVKVG